MLLPPVRASIRCAAEVGGAGHALYRDGGLRQPAPVPELQGRLEAKSDTG